MAEEKTVDFQSEVNALVAKASIDVTPASKEYRPKSVTPRASNIKRAENRVSIIFTKVFAY